MPRCHCCHDILEKCIRKKHSSYHDSLHPCAEAHCVRIYSFRPSRSTLHPHLPCFRLRAVDLYLTAGGTPKREPWPGIRCRGEGSARCLFLWFPPSVFLQGGSFPRSETLSMSLLDSHLLGSDLLPPLRPRGINSPLWQVLGSCTAIMIHIFVLVPLLKPPRIAQFACAKLLLLGFCQIDRTCPQLENYICLGLLSLGKKYK